MQVLKEPAREIPIVRDTDVVVAGGGPGGIMAALAAARAGAKTLLVERYGFLGGMATAGLMTSFNGFRNEHPPNHVQTVRGIPQELIDRLLKAGDACARTAHGHFGDLKPGECPYAVSFDPEVLKQVVLEMLAEAGVDIMLHTLLCDAPADGRNVSAIVVENKSGRQAIKGRMYVDATGDGDLAARAGAAYEKVEKVGQHMMGMSLMYRVAGMPDPQVGQYRLWINGFTTRWGPGVGQLDGSDADDMTEAEIKTRLQVRKHVAGLQEQFPDARLVETAMTIGVRETRRVVGLYSITEEDCLTGRAQPDSIAVSSNPVPGYYGKRRFFDHLGFEIPYRSLVPADLDNLLLAGRCISASQPAFQSARSMAPLMAISQATGTAAAMCIADGCRPADLDVASLQKKLQDDGAVTCIPPEERS
ncbi:MAG: FAD-dependent oxidoreductase [Planctomycetes bacterium]|nr:FAD-dependent oxidoreductase [Planctomycetota bacterium]